MSEVSFYDAVGGHATFERLVAEFYRGVADDAELRALYPESDLAPAATRLRLFLEQYWGGPTTYSDERGHPRLRMRHQPYAVTPARPGRVFTRQHPRGSPAHRRLTFSLRLHDERPR